MNNEVTVVIPAYKAGRTLKSTVQSVSAQSLLPSEVIIVVNGNDETLKVALEVKSEYSKLNIKVLAPEEETIGVDLNWNKASESSQTKYTKLLCADDILEQNALELQVNFLEQNQDCEFVGSQRKIVTDKGKVIFGSIGGLLLGERSSYKKIRLISTLLGTNVIGEPSAVLFRTNSLKSNLPWSASIPYVIDLDMYLRILKPNKYVGFIKSPICRFVISKNSWSTSLAKYQHDNFVQFMMIEWEGEKGKQVMVAIASASSKINAYLRGLIYKKIY